MVMSLPLHNTRCHAMSDIKGWYRDQTENGALVGEPTVTSAAKVWKQPELRIYNVINIYEATDTISRPWCQVSVTDCK